ncbi:Uu.00g103100.m01.CDS01 [Anthostomella pinea]|uniref:Uu.00g103100.m01.CDS01 n=1 Tax=Anthostomella pinea TaxID=933095 RepID=A0AAI8VEH9_9PEZI|nr:Uu.00g103100.m01.CDS01 [Anthostomella pinea]
MDSHDAADLVNPLHPSVVGLVDPTYAEIYTQYQAPKLRADQVPYEEYIKDPQKYTFPTHEVASTSPEVASNEIYPVTVWSPPGKIQVQVYVPTPDAIASGGLKNDDGLPTLVNFHGGGFVLGGLKDDEVLCRQLCQRVGCIVVNVDYRTAPDYPHPTPVLDSWEALQWVFKWAEKYNIDPWRVAVSGLSAGGCIAAVLSILARDKPTRPLVLQLLMVPLVDARFVPPSVSWGPNPYHSYVRLEHAPMLPLVRLSWFYNLWLGTDEGREEKVKDFRASPILAESHANLAPASIRCAGVDPLVAEGIAYYDKLKAAGTQSKIKVYKGQGHTLPHWDGANPASKVFVEDCIGDLKGAFSEKKIEAWDDGELGDTMKLLSE